MNLQNLVNYCRDFDLPDPFSEAIVPYPLNHDTCISAIMIRCGLLTPVFNDPDTFRNATTQWFAQKQWTFAHLIKIIEAEYNPVENVFEEREEITNNGSKDIHTGGFKDKDSGNDKLSMSGTDRRDIVHGGTDTTTNEISAFNSTSYQADNKSSTTNGHTVDDDITYGKYEDTTYGKETKRTYENDTLSRTENGKLTMKRHGNIGITSADELINQELELLRHFDVYGFIAEQFEKDNMIMIY